MYTYIIIFPYFQDSFLNVRVKVPQLNTLSSIQGANLVNGIGFEVTDPDVSGEDIFGRLVPMEAHEGSSLYSEEKAQLLRTIGAKVEQKNVELTTYMSSLNLENLNISEERANKIPQGIVDRCAALNANTEAIPDLISSMSI
uniref:BRO1 domain-containing protein n=1 Tax=Megaselia scalaris TaxID=36166 RepID=T1GKR7_MEGSC